MNVLQYFKPVTTFVLDIDGVLTDGTLYLIGNGIMARRMNIKDGYVLQLAIKKGYRVLVISGSNSSEVTHRLQKLGVTDVHMNVEDKLELMKDYIEQHGLKKEEVLVMGDDVPDYAILKEAGLSTCPADAAMDIKNIVQYTSPFKGGEGCVRDVIEKVLKLRGDWWMDTTIKSQ